MAKSAKEKARTKARTPGPANRGKRAGQGALRAGSAFAKSNASAKTGRTAPNGQQDVKSNHSHLRSENTIKRLNMYKSKPDKHRMKEQSTKPVRIQPDRRWFGNTRVIAQDKMQAFRETMSKGVEDPFSVVLRSSKLPMSLLKETEEKASRMNLLSVEPFKEVFGKGRRQKKAKLASYDLEGLMQSVSQKTQGYNGDKDTKSAVDASSGLDKEGPSGMRHFGEEIFNKGTSKRIWGELYKVVDASDVILFILDARDPMGTRCQELERELRKNRPGKHIVLVLNKVDLIPTWAARRWVQVLMKEYPTLAFHASITNPFGKNALLNLLRQFGTLIKERKHITIGMVGYPNVGKSSVINAMKRKKVCKAAPVPGETRVWQYISLTKKLYLLDCPGIVPPTASDFSADCAKVLKGVVRAERIQTPSDYIDEVLARVKPQYLRQRYKLPPETTWKDGEDFLGTLARKMGKLLRGGDPDLEITSRIVLYDWQRGRIPFFTPPPEVGEAPAAAPINTAPAAASSSSSAAAAAPPAAADATQEEGAEADAAAAAASSEEKPAEASKDEAPAASSAGAVSVRQSMAELSCSMVFDDEDRRGEALPEPAPKKKDKEEPKAMNGRKRRRMKEQAAEAAAEAAANADGEEGAGAEEAAAGPKKAKRRKKASGANKGAEAQGGGMAVQQGSMDWKAVVAEFDM